MGAALLRQPLLAAARSQSLRRIAQGSRVSRRVVDRYVAGEDEADALRVSRELVSAQLMVTLDFLGENVTSAQEAGDTVNAYCSVLRLIGESGLAGSVEVSVKLSAIGQALPGHGDEVALAGVRAICGAAADVGTTVTLDMEDHTTTDATLDVLSQARADYPWLGAVLQAYLRRTESDCADLATMGSRVRLCKGAYAEPESVAYRGAEVGQSYLRCLDILLGGAGYPMIATHDPAMITAAEASIRDHGRAVDSYEFQMLHGVRPRAQRSVAESGQRMRVYLPYGGQWYGYFMRRLTERPANLALFLRSMSSRK